MKALKLGVLQEILTAAKFGVVGMLATVVHLTVALSLIVFANTGSVTANFAAFLCAFLFSFLGHFHWTFNGRSSRVGSFVKFFTIALSAFVVNNIVLINLIEAGGMAKEWAVLIAAFVIPPVTYLGSRLWGFREDGSEEGI